MLDHVGLHVADVERSVAFYRDVVGLVPIERATFPFPGAWFRIGPVGGPQTLHLLGWRKEEVRSDRRGTHFAIRVASVADAKRRLESRGVEVEGPQTRSDGALQIFIRDPDGHAVEFCQMPDGTGA